MRSLLLFSATALAAVLPESSNSNSKLFRRSGTVWATPHESYSSSIGVLGCKINTNRVAYWPGSIDCNNICVRLSNEGRSVKLLKIDTSGGAYDVSYDAWNYLITGDSATENPVTGGETPMEYEFLPADECKELLTGSDGKLPLSASNSMNYLASCLDEPGSWVGSNYKLYNVLDPICTLGCDEECHLDWPTANQADCPSGLGVPSTLENQAVVNIQYSTGKGVLAGSGEVVAVSVSSTTDTESSGAAKPAPSTTKLDFTYSKIYTFGSDSKKAALNKFSEEAPSGSGGSSTTTGSGSAAGNVYIPLSILVPVLASFWLG